MGEQIELGTNIKNGLETTDNLRIQIIRNAFKLVVAGVEVKIPHMFVTRIPNVVQLTDGNGGIIYDGTTPNDKGCVYLKSSTDYNPVSLKLF